MLFNFISTFQLKTKENIENNDGYIINHFYY